MSYKIFDTQSFYNAFKESSINLNMELLFAGNLSLEEDDDNAPVSAEELISQAKQRAYTTGEKRKRPSSKSTKSTFPCGRATREVEIIWWPDLYDLTDHGRLVIRIFIEKCVLK
jgi:hypothetical protein